MFSNEDRCSYAAPPLIEAICQLRFPTILSIDAQQPAAFQEAIRGEYPRYAVKDERPQGQQGSTVHNYNFLSEDNRWKVNLTSGFIALSTLQYGRWEQFAGRLDKLLAVFIEVYHPAFFERIGLRYVNAVSRKRLRLEETPWADLIQPMYLGALGEPDVAEGSLSKCTVDLELDLGSCRLKTHAGLGLLGDGKKDPEVKFILDHDFSSAGNIPMASVPEKLQTMHALADRAFRGAITDELHTAMGPMLLD